MLKVGWFVYYYFKDYEGCKVMMDEAPLFHVSS